MTVLAEFHLEFVPVDPNAGNKNLNFLQFANQYYEPGITTTITVLTRWILRTSFSERKLKYSAMKFTPSVNANDPNLRDIVTAKITPGRDFIETHGMSGLSSDELAKFVKQVNLVTKIMNKDYYLRLTCLGAYPV